MTEESKYRLKAARKLRGLTLREAAKLLGFSHQALDKYEKGKTAVDSSRLQKFATAYDVTMDYLIGTRKPIEFGEVIWFKINWDLEP